MQPQPHTQVLDKTTSHGGGRVASDAYRYSLAQSEEFAGLEEGASRYELLLLVKKAGKLAGFTPRMIVLLDYYLAYTRDCDWEEGSRPIVYQSLARTALDLGVSERQVQKLESALFDAGAIGWNDSGNHRRYGQRDPQSGRILYAFGVDLTPLAYLREELEAKLHEKELYDQAWLETKRQISWLRRQIRARLAEIEREEGACQANEARYEAIATKIRTHIDLRTLRAMLNEHETLYQELLVSAEPRTVDGASEKRSTAECSPKDEREFVHYKYTTHQSIESCSPQDARFQESVAEPPPLPEQADVGGAKHVSLNQVLEAAGERYRAHLPIRTRPTSWSDFIEAACRTRAELRISQQSWADACRVLGRVGASLCVLLTDRALDRPKDPVRQPAAYFRGMVNRAREGELRLHNSVYGLIK